MERLGSRSKQKSDCRYQDSRVFFRVKFYKSLDSMDPKEFSSSVLELNKGMVQLKKKKEKKRMVLITTTNYFFEKFTQYHRTKSI